jgi:hypothetical protein
LISRFQTWRISRVERLNPVMLKTLWTGLRTGSFVGSFLGLHIAMSVLFVIAVAMRMQDPGGSSDQGMLALAWFIVGFVLYIAFPVGGLNSLRVEMRDGKLELILLTGIRAHPLIRGIWAALLLEEAVLMVSVIPYFVLRYYLGGADFIMDIARLLILLLFSSVSLALSIGISTCKLSDAHAIFLLGLVFSVGGLAGPVVAMGSAGFGPMLLSAFALYAAAGLPLTWLGWSMAYGFIDEKIRAGG